MFQIMQGDSYNIPIQIQIDSGVADISSFSEVEITIGNIRKTLSSGIVFYDDIEQCFLFPLTQKESFNLTPGGHYIYIRVKLKNSNNVFGTVLYDINVIESKSKEVL